MNTWSTEKTDTINTELNNVKERDLRFFRIDEFIRNIKRTDEFSGDCTQCKRNKNEIDNVVATIEEAVNVPGKTRRSLDRTIGNISRHMLKEHQFYTPFHFAYLYSFFGTTAGLLIGYLASLATSPHEFITIATGIMIGLLIGYFSGNKKDKKIRKDKKLM